MINDNEGFEVANVGQVPFPNPSEAQHLIWNTRMSSSNVSSVFVLLHQLMFKLMDQLSLVSKKLTLCSQETQTRFLNMLIKTFTRCLCRKT